MDNEMLSWSNLLVFRVLWLHIYFKKSHSYLQHFRSNYAILTTYIFNTQFRKNPLGRWKKIILKVVGQRSKSNCIIVDIYIIVNQQAHAMKTD
ncbi:hypothetical protein BpHYR1_054319 [Brachionus plicatilis]|uniref:Uncharacterized protein n=1 Tax=Brachionus plicatilis TaxID=10195 RepID=A0A3M7QT29_BRAPC|nr:hypothetical protein BpHYR1_054319 [Brachionus plicatilis]